MLIFMAIAEGEGRGGGGGLGKGGRGETEEEEQSPKRYMVSDTCCPNIDFGAAAPKGTKSFRTRGIPVCLFVHLSIHPFVRPPPGASEVQIWPPRLIFGL